MPEEGRRPVNILLVDDQPANLLALRAILDNLNENLIEAGSGEDALRRLEEKDFAVVLMDVQLRGLDGFETARQLRARSRSRHTPVIFLTAHDENRLSVQQAYKHGAVDYLFKPIVPAILRAKVEVFVELFRKTEQIRVQAEQLRELERQRAEQALIASEARKDALLDLTLDGVITLDHESKVLEFNAAAERIFGYRRAEIIGQDLADFLIPERLRARHRQGMARYLKTGESAVINRRIEMVAHDRQGVEFPVELAIIRIPSTEPALFTGFVRNISERKRAEQRRATQLAVSQILAGGESASEALVGILRAVGEGLQWTAGSIWRVDPDGLVLRCIQFWHSPAVAVGEFETATLRRTFSLGQGLPGRVWASGLPAWIREVQADDNFPRRAAAAQTGIHSAFAFPILLERQTVGVIEFFSQTSQEPDDDLLMLMSTIGIHVGQFLDRRRFEEERRASEQRFSRFMQNLPGLAWIKDLEGRYVYANEAAQRAFGHSWDKLNGRSDCQLFPPATATQFRQNDDQALVSDAGIQTIETLAQPDGVLHHSLVSKFAILDSESRPALIGGMAIDITELKHAEAALRESEARFRNMADYAPVLIWVNDLAGCEFVNSEYLRFLSRDYEQVRGMQWVDALHPDDAEGYLRSYRRALEEQRPFEEQVRMRRGDGEYRWMRSRGTPRFRADGAFLGFVGCSVDITDIKNSEAFLKDADRRKDEFLATLAHELRNPLAPIRNSLHILRLSGGEGGSQIVEMMERQVNHMVRLVDDLLEVSRITRGKIDLKKERLNLAVIVRNAVETVAALCAKGQHRLTIELPAEPLWLVGDAVRLTQVVANLLNNAAKYTEDGGQIWLTARAEEDQVVMAIRDTGVGIPPEMLPSVFELFTQVDRHLGRAQGGLGIGLALVRRLVELHGGSVRACSSGSGQGAEFIVCLPADRSQPSAARPLEVAVPQSAGPPPCRLLVVDDNRDAADSLGVLLQFLGLEVKVVYDGPTALLAFSQSRPHAVFLDIGMPGMDGYEVARRIRQNAGHEVLLIALTGWGQEEDRRRSRAAGFDHHLVKPVAPEVLESLIRSFAS